MTFSDDAEMFMWIMISLFWLLLFLRTFAVVYLAKQFPAMKDALANHLFLVVIVYLFSQSAAAALHPREPGNVEAIVRNAQDRVAGELPTYR